jgi:serine/threonine-protein kinase
MGITIDELSFESLFRVRPLMDLTDKNFLVKERFKVLHLLYETTRTNVFLGMDLKEEKKVLVHVLKNQFFKQGRQELQQWILQVKRIAACTGTNSVLRPLELGLWRRKFIVVTRYFEGMPLFDLVLAKRELPVEFCLKVIGNICSLYRYARSVNFLAGSLSKEDIFINREGEIRVLKFSPSRINPRAEGSEDDLSRIYYLGCLLYELFTNEVPFQGKRTHVQQEKAHLLAVLRVRSHTAHESLYDDIVDLFVKCTTKDVENRINLLDELREQLDSLHKKAIQIQEGYEEREEKEQLNSAFDVVSVLKEGLPEEEERQYSRVWTTMDTGGKARRPDSEAIFRWVAILIILGSFAYKFFY